MSWGAFARSSPSSPGATFLPFASTAINSTPGIALPSVNASFSSGSVFAPIVRIGASVSPHPDTIPEPPNSAFTSEWS